VLNEGKAGGGARSETEGRRPYDLAGQHLAGRERRGFGQLLGRRRQIRAAEVMDGGVDGYLGECGCRNAVNLQGGQVGLEVKVTTTTTMRMMEAHLRRMWMLASIRAGHRAPRRSCLGCC